MYAAYDFVVMSSLLQPLMLSTIQVAWASLQKTIDTRVFSFSTLCLLFYPVYFYYTDKHSPHEVKIRKYVSALGHRNQSRPDSHQHPKRKNMSSLEVWCTGNNITSSVKQYHLFKSRTLNLWWPSDPNL